MEDPPGSNAGPEVEPLQKNVGVSKGDPWCAAWVYSVFKNSDLPKKIKDKVPKTAGVKLMWEKSTGAKKILAKDAIKDPSIVKPGMVFFYLTKNEKGNYSGSGHTGIIVSVNPKTGKWASIEGNTNPMDGAREGYGTFLVDRSFADPSIAKDPKLHPALLLGFVDYLDGLRNTDDPEYIKFLRKLESLESQFRSSANAEIRRLQKNPSLLDQYEKNYKDRYKK